MQKILYFTARPLPTAEEISDIEAINAIVSSYNLSVATAAVPAGLGLDENGDPVLDVCDYVAGTVPAEYSDKPVFDPDNPPVDIGDDQVIITNGDAVTAELNGTSMSLTPAVTGSALDGIQTPATVAVVENSDTAPIQNSAGAAIGTGSLTVAGRAVSYARLPATIAGVANTSAAQVLPASGATPLVAGTAAVAAGVLTGVRLDATAGVVTNGQEIAVTGGTVAITVAANVVTAEFTPEA